MPVRNRLILIVLSAALLLSLVACGSAPTSSPAETVAVSSSDSPVVSSESEDSVPVEDSPAATEQPVLSAAACKELEPLYTAAHEMGNLARNINSYLNNYTYFGEISAEQMEENICAFADDFVSFCENIHNLSAECDSVKDFLAEAELEFTDVYSQIMTIKENGKMSPDSGETLDFGKIYEIEYALGNLAFPIDIQ